MTAREKPPVWGDRLAKMADPAAGQGSQTRAPSPFSQKSLPMVVPMERWEDFEEVFLDDEHLAQNRIINGDQEHPAQAAFDVLRTKLLQTLRERGWKKVGITSPTKGCGKTFIAANLALSLSRRAGSRTILLDMDLRNPGLADTLGISYPGTMRSFLTGHKRGADYLLKIGENLVLGLNDTPEEEAADLMQQLRTRDVLEAMITDLIPDVVLFDLPPALQNDDVLSFLPQVDGVLMVIGGGITKAADVRRVETMLGNQVPLLGVILNKDEAFSSNIF